MALVSLATMLAAYPFSSVKSGSFLALAAMKQSLVFPLFLHLLLKRSKAILVPIAAIALCGLAALWWSRLGFAEGLKLPKYWADTANSWTTIDHTCLRRLLAVFISDKLTVAVSMWVIWFALFGITVRWIKEPIVQLAALFLLALLPTYHYSYDMIMAVPSLALFLKRYHLVWPTLMTAALSISPQNLGRLMPSGPWRTVVDSAEQAYLPFLILLFLGGLIWMERRPQDSPAPTGP